MSKQTRKRCLPKEKSKSLNFFDIQLDPLPKMVANDSSAVVASIPALKLGPKAVLVSKASFVIFPGAMLEIWLAEIKTNRVFERKEERVYKALHLGDTFNLFSTTGLAFTNTKADKLYISGFVAKFRHENQLPPYWKFLKTTCFYFNILQKVAMNLAFKQLKNAIKWL